MCGILAAVFIYWGAKKTKRHEQVEERLRAALAMEDPNMVIGETNQPQDPLPGITMTTASTPILPGAEPRCIDYADTTSTQQGSLASIPIVDSMTVPPLEVLEHTNEKIC